MTATGDRDLDFCDPRFYDDPWETYSWLRHNAPIYRDEANDLWVVSRHEDVFHISREPRLYCNRYGVRPKIAGDMSIITMDGDEHLDTRRLIRQGFTPRQVRRLIPHVRDLTNEIVDRIAEKGNADFVEEFAIHVPLIIICELLGLDPETRMKMYRWSDAMMEGDGHVEADDPKLIAAAEAFGEYAAVLIELIAERRADPAVEDLIGVLTHAYDAGDLTRDTFAISGVSEERRQEILANRKQLDDDELLAFLTVLLVAGNETTRNAITGAMLALSRFPEERERLIANLDDDRFVDLAVDELIRWVSPVMSFIRTVTTDHTYKGVDFAEGDRILMLYQSANRDEEVFDRPDDLILDRDPNPHLAFGIGPHFCLGANLARMEVKTVFQELFYRLPDIVVPDGATRRRGDSTLVISLQHLPANFTPESEITDALRPAHVAQGCPVHNG